MKKLIGKELHQAMAWPGPAVMGNSMVPGSMIEHPALEEGLTKRMAKIAMS